MDTSTVMDSCTMATILEASVETLQRELPVNKLDDLDRSYAVFVNVGYAKVIQVLLPEATTRWLRKCGISAEAESVIGVLLAGRNFEIADTAEEIRAHMTNARPLTSDRIVEAVGLLFEELGDYVIDPVAVLNAVSCA
jgi:hypothetical protein